MINSNETQSLEIADSITEEFVGKCWLGLAELQASKNQFSEAIDIATKVNNKSPDYTDAKILIDEWSEELFKEAQIICENEGDISLAEQKLSYIPESSKWKKEALNLINNCQKPQIEDGVINLCPGPLCPE